jgi:hypothetical protein
MGAYEVLDMKPWKCTYINIFDSDTEMSVGGRLRTRRDFFFFFFVKIKSIHSRKETC